MKKLIALIVVLLCCLLIIVGLNPNVITIATDGYAMPASATIEANLSKTSSGKIELQYIEEDGLIYSSMFQDYDYETKTALDLSYPLYVNGGAGLMFLNNDFWLIADDFNILETYEDLYLTDGHTYNADLSLADGDEFLLVAVGDGVYMNAQSAVFSTAFEDISIPANSIIRFTSDNVNFYSYKEGELTYTGIDEMFSATITIGDHTYSYSDFLNALGIFESAIGSASTGQDLADIQDEMSAVVRDESDTTGNDSTKEKDTDSDAFEQLNVETATGVADAEGTAEGDAGTAEAELGEGDSDQSESSGSSSSSGDSSGGDSGDGEGSSSDSGSGGGNTGATSDAEGENDGTEGGGEGTGESLDPVYEIPVVTIDDITSWAYAINGDLNISDPTGIIRKGVSFTVYSSLKPSGSITPDYTEDSVNVYSADTYTGYIAKVRKTFYSSQEFTLDGIEPGQSYYIQYSYTYTAEVEKTDDEGKPVLDEDGNVVKEYQTIAVSSDFYEVATTAIEDSEIQTLVVSYNNDITFAEYDDRFGWDDFTIANQSEYDAEDDSFENFILDTTPYFNKLILTMIKENATLPETLAGEDKITVTITSSYLKKAMLEGGLDYVCSGLLDSDSKYTYTLSAVDKYGNELPVIINGVDIGDYTDTVFTRKETPTVTIEEVVNVTDELTLKVTVSDPDGALTSSDLYLIALDPLDASGTPVYLSGSWVTNDGDSSISDGDAMASDESNYLWLENVADGSEYEFLINSLAFDYAYTFSVYGDYDLQPTDAPVSEGYTALGEETNALLGYKKSSTAAMSTGSLQASLGILSSQILDTGVTFSVELSSTCSTAVLALVDEFILTVTDTDNNKDRVEIELIESELSQLYIDSVDSEGAAIYTYDESTKSIILSNEGGVMVELVGERAEFDNISLWDALLIAQQNTYDETTGEIVSSTTKEAVALRITVERYENESDRILQSFTSHEISYDAIVVKSGHTYVLPVSLSTYKFNTKKLEPIVSMSDTFIANDVVRFFDFEITDTDDAIVNADEVQLLLYSTVINDDGTYSKGSLLQKQTITVVSGKEVEQDIEFSGLTQGLNYIIEVVASDYNNDSGYANYTTNYTLKTYEIEAGSDIKAVITLNSLDYVYNERLADPVISLTGSEITALTEDAVVEAMSANLTGWFIRNDGYTNGIWTECFELPDGVGYGEEINAIEIDYPAAVNSTSTDSTVYPNTNIYFYDANYIQIDSTLSISRIYGDVPVALIPLGAVYVRFSFGDLDYLKEYGFDIYGYYVDVAATDGSDLVVNLVANDSTNSSAFLNSAYTGTSTEIMDNTYNSGWSYEYFTSNTSYRTVAYVPVTPGDVYFSTTNNCANYFYYYNDQMEYVGHSDNVYKNTEIVIPENVYYISFSVYNSQSFQLYQLTGATGEGELGAKYELNADITIYSKDDILDDVSIVLEYSDVINTDALAEDSYTELETDLRGETVSSLVLNLTYDAEAGGYTAAYEDYCALLEPNTSYKLSVQGYYQGTLLTITSQTVSTDSALIMINSAADFTKIYNYPYANFLVTADFELNAGSSGNFTFYGNLDVNGHVITIGENFTSAYLIRYLGESGVIKNAVFRIESGRVDPIAYDNYGLIENVMIQTVGATQTHGTYDAFFSTSNFGTIRSFVVQLGGDVTFNYSTGALIVGINRGGTIEEGYIYTTMNYAIIIPDDELTYVGGVTGWTWNSSGIIQNIYSVYNVYINEGTYSNSEQVGYVFNGYNYSSSVNNLYHVGDFYEYSTTKGKTSNLLTYQRIVNNRIVYGQTDQVWSITENEYSPSNSYDDTMTAGTQTLTDAAWQSTVLTSGFDVEGTVSMGYYPRLDWPTCMQQYQEYVTLPQTSLATAPEIINDAFSTATEYAGLNDNDSGYIVLYCDNPYEYEITAVTVTGLTTEVVGTQSMGDDGFWQVTLKVAVSTGADARYMSTYNVTGLTFTNGRATQTDKIDYDTQNIAFYKEIANAAEWYEINNNMSWNYRLTADIDFSGSNVSTGGIMINGSVSSVTNTSTFYGTIDGGKYDSDGNLIGYYTLQNITLNNVAYPAIIYTMAYSATLQNIGFDNLTLVGATAQSSSYVGIARYAYSGSVIENVHVTNSTVTGAGYVGVLAGFLRGTVRNCTVNDTAVTLKSARYTVSIGGLVGQAEYATIHNSYVNGMTIEAYNGSTINGIGGLVGYATNCSIFDCYAQGTIESDAQNVGGAVGKALDTYTTIENIITNVDITTTSVSVGGIAGYNGAMLFNNFAMGDIFAGSTNVHRLVGLTACMQYILNPGYAYEGQIVNAVSSDDTDGAIYLYSSEELARRSTWIDGMSFGSQWDYSALDDGYLPKLYYYDTTTLLPGQGEEDEGGITMPGVTAFSATFESAEINTDNSGNTSYEVTVKVQSTDGSMTADEIKDALSYTMVASTTGVAQFTWGDISFAIEGMEMEDVYFKEYVADVTSQSQWTYELYASGDTVYVVITTKTFENAFDTYKLVFTQSNNTIATVIVDYGAPLYHTVSNLTEWNDLMYTGHGKTVENFLIDGTINFDGTTEYTNLLLGELKGTGDAKFTNLTFATNATVSGNWILSCKSISGIDFEGFSASFLTVPVYQTMATFVGYCTNGVSDVNISDMTIKTKNNTGGSLGFIYEVTGNVTEVTVKNSSFVSEASSGTSTRYSSGSIAARLLGSAANIVIEDVEVTNTYCTYTSAVAGYMNGMTGTGNTTNNENIYLSNVTVSGRDRVGGVVGYATDILGFINIVVDNADIVGIYHTGGIGGYVYQAGSATNTDFTVINSSVVSTYDGTSIYNVGGLFGYKDYDGWLYNVYVENVTVQGSGRVGGVTGLSESIGMNGVQVVDCTIIQKSTSKLDGTYTVGAGGVMGYNTYEWAEYRNMVVRNTSIVGDYHVGGIAGASSYHDRILLRSCYVAEDVSVTARYNDAGGLVGYANYYYIYNCETGATVTAMGSNAGGVIGYVYDTTTSTSYQYVTGTYVGGTIVGLDNVGGVFGYVSAETVMSTSRTAGVIVAADLVSSDTVDPVANFASKTSSSGMKVGVWDNLLINGQTAQSLFCTSTTASADVAGRTAMQVSASFLSASDTATSDAFLLKSTYSTYGFAYYNSSLLITGTTSSDAIEANPYIPFITNYTAGTTLANTSSYQVLDSTEGVNGVTWSDTDGDGWNDSYTLTMETQDSSTGILRPTSGEREGATVVYVSGIDSINIETTQASVTITMGNGQTITAPEGADLVNNSDGSYTYTFASTDLYGNTYNTITLGYDFISDVTVDGVTYTCAELARSVMTSGVYWFYLANDGNVMYGGNNSATAAADTQISDAVYHLWQGQALTSSDVIYTFNASTAKWILSEETVLSPGAIQASATPIFYNYGYSVYYNYTMNSSNVYYPYRVLALSSATTYPVFSAQGIQYDGYILSTVSSTTYFAMLSNQTNTITSYLSAMNTDEDFVNEDIVQMSNSFGYTGQIAVLRYEDGSVKVWNFTTGAMILEVDSTATYNGKGSGANGISVFGLSSGSDTAEETNGGIMTMSASAMSFASSYVNSLFTTTDVSEIPTDTSYTDSEASLANYLDVTEDDSVSTDLFESDGSSDITQSDETEDTDAENGTATGGTDGAESTDGAADAVDGTGEADEAGNSSADGSNTTSGTSTANGSGATGTATDATQSTDTETDATGADGSADTTADASTGANGDAESEYTIGYNPYTGSYEVYMTAEITEGTQSAQSLNATITDTLLAANGADSDLALSDSDFIINRFSMRVLSNDERNGFALLSIIVLAGVAVLMVLHIKYKKR